MAFFLIFILSSAFAGPFKIQVVSEPGAEARAVEFIENVSQIEPFYQLIQQGAMEISPTPKMVNTLNCKGGHLGIERLAKCDLNRLGSVCSKVDFCPVFTAVPNIGAGNAKNPISSGTFPWTTMLHEMTHSFGFTDDTSYSLSECATYCSYNPWKNTVTDNKTNRYKSKAEAIDACKKRVFWCREAIDEGSEVVQAKGDGTFMIGSPAPVEGCPNTKLGVYLGGNCQRIHPESTWRPYFCPTVMGHPDLSEQQCPVVKRHSVIKISPNLLPPFYQKQIFQEILRKKNLRGLTFKPSSPETASPSFRYGMPTLDILAHPEGPLPDTCKGPGFKSFNSSQGMTCGDLIQE